MSIATNKETGTVQALTKEDTSPVLHVVSKEERVKSIHDTFMLLMQVSKRWLVQRLQVFGLTPPQFITLAALAAHEQACTMSDITNVTFQDPPTTTGIIDRLVKMSLVDRSRSQTDRRVVLVKATQMGVELIDQIEGKLMEVATPTYTLLTEEELITFERLLRRLLRAHLQQYKSLSGTDLDTEIAKLEQFVKDPISYSQLEGSTTT